MRCVIEAMQRGMVAILVLWHDAVRTAVRNVGLALRAAMRCRVQRGNLGQVVGRISFSLGGANAWLALGAMAGGTRV